ncbi:MAG: glycosyltransferase 87 family protein [Acidobacteriota bacterium]|nr:glycosyltransferase 87 family protein [Acidobacteriota bacterium]
MTALSKPRSQPIATHPIALSVLAVLLLVAFYSDVMSSTALRDEQTYFEAFEEVREARSPYQVKGFYYFPVFAVAGAVLLDNTGTSWTLAVMRASNLAGLLAVVWVAMAWLPIRLRYRLAAAAAVLLLAPGVRLGVATGNFSFLATALVLMGLHVGMRTPLAAGALLGTSIVIKPLAAVAVPMLALQRAKPALDLRHRALIIVGAAGAAPMLLVGARFWPGFFAVGSTQLYEVFPISRTVSFHRLLYSAGFELAPAWGSLLVLVAALVVARWRPWTPMQLVCIAIAATTLTSPALWNHTLLVTLPLQVLALWILRHRWTSRDIEETSLAFRRRRLLAYEAVAVGAAILAIQLSDGVGAFLPQPSPQLFLALLPPCLAPSALAAYVATGLERGNAAPLH